MKLRDGMKANKFIGALTIELVREKLIKEGFNMSNRDVFIKGIPYELNLIILKKCEKAQKNLLYEPGQVIAVLEIKFRGIYGESDIKNIRKVFNSIKKVNRKIKCIYLTISENTRYKYWPLQRKLGDFSFSLLTRKTNLEKAIKDGKLYLGDEWNKLISLLKKYQT